MSVYTLRKPGIVMLILVGFVSGILVGPFFFDSSDGKSEEAIDDGPLYWVAPMDPNYRRDQPGKSPMGMDLIPVYDEDLSSGEAKGIIKISPEVENNLGLKTVKVEKKKLRHEIKAMGYVKYDETKLVHIHPRVSGWVDKLYVTATGDPVKQGAPLYALYSPELVNAQEEFVLALNLGDKRLVTASENRLRALKIPDYFIDKLKKSRAVQQTVTFYSPQDGVVDDLNIREGFYVQPGRTLFSIGSLSRVWLEAEVFERQAPLVKVGADAVIELDFASSKTWTGKIQYIYPKLNNETRTLRFRIPLENKDLELLPEMFANVTILSSDRPAALVIPRQALIRTGDQDRVVLALGEGRFKSIEVVTGSSNQQFIEILEGLEEGETVVSSAHFLLDSESSIASDFKRIDSAEVPPETVWVSGVIKAQIAKENKVTASHEAIKEWNWMAMTMDFLVADNVNFDELIPGTKLHMEIKKGESGTYAIVGTHIMNGGMGAEMSKDDSISDKQWAEVEGRINSVNIGDRLLNISRGPIEKWNRPAATMDFYLAESVAIDSMKAGETIHFRFKIVEGEFIISDILDEPKQEPVLQHKAPAEVHDSHKHQMMNEEKK